jgi:hypothetical protein
MSISLGRGFRNRVVLAVLCIAGAGLTVAASRIGLGRLGCLTRKPCGCLAGHQRVRLAAVARAADEFILERGRCPTGTEELVDNNYLAGPLRQDAWGGVVVVSCRSDANRRDLRVVAPGPDHQVGTDDDIVYSSN